MGRFFLATNLTKPNRFFFLCRDLGDFLFFSFLVTYEEKVLAFAQNAKNISKARPPGYKFEVMKSLYHNKVCVKFFFSTRKI